VGDLETTGGGALEPIPGDAAELDVSEPARRTHPLRRRRTRIVLAGIVAVVGAAAAGGLALASTRPAPIGSGIVVIDTNLAYQGARAAGTGMVLTSSGTVLTNNHVIRGATRIRVVVPTTGRSFTAHVVGYDTSDDVAVLQASGASNLKTMPLGDSSGLTVGDSVTALGNAGGTGALKVASGTVTGLDRGITVGDDQGGSESLRGMIVTNAAVQPGDSGGPLLNTSGQAVGMDTAASVGNGIAQPSSSTGFAIPIDRALEIADQIIHGDTSGGIHVGGTAFLGVEVEANSYGGSGAVITSVVPGSAADAAGLTAGDLITAVGNQEVSSPDALTAIVAAQQPGTSITATIVDQYGSSQTASLSLGSGPPR
jgi:S1-C subfamily serine protease